MAKLARDIMTPNPACCGPTATLDDVAKLMAHNDCGEIPVVDPADQIIGVITDRDIVCRVVAEGKNPMAYTADSCMSGAVVTVRGDATLQEVVAAMERAQVRRVPVVDERDTRIGIISQADESWTTSPQQIAKFVREVSRDTVRASR